MSDWEDNSAPSKNGSSFNTNGGQTFGKGRGFGNPSESNSGFGGGGFRSRNDEDGGGRGGRGGRGGGRGGGFRSRNGDDDGGWGSNARGNNDNEDGGYGEERRGRGGRGGRGGGGFRSRNDDDDGGWGSNSQSNNDNKDGGYGEERRGRGGRGGRGGGGFRSRNDDDGGWGGDSRGSNDNEDGSYGEERQGRGGRGGRGRGRGFGRRDDHEDGGGDEDGGFRRGGRGGGRGGYGRRDDDDEGGYGGGGGGFRSRNDDNEEGGFRGRGHGGGRGGRGRGGGGWGSDDKDNEEKAEDEKPKEIYIPQAPSEDDNVIFGSGVGTGINFSKYEDIEVKVTGENVPPPIKTFETAGLRQIVLDNVIKSKYTTVTPVQKYSIPIIMGGRDLMACAQTGSGKTAAFLLPIISTLLENPADLVYGECKPQCLILSPTRELAIQTYENARKFARTSLVKAALVYGGTSINHQIREIEKGCHILVASPGRLMDFVSRGRISFSALRFFVLDEADRLLEEGFQEKLNEMLDHETMVPKEQRQTLMFSATFAQDVQHLAATFLRDYVFLTVGVVGGACSDIKQSIYEVSKYEKKDKITELLQREQSSGRLQKTIVFVGMQRDADFLASYFVENGIQATSIHGARLQSQRAQALRDFSVDCKPVLVATDVAARGLDIKDVAHVINYAMPKDIDYYVHRIGRTGRVGNIGRSTSFFDSAYDSKLANDLVRILRQANQEVPEWLASCEDRSFAPGCSNTFGGQDVRDFGGDDGNNFQSGSAEPEETW